MERGSARPALVPIKGGPSPAYLLIPVFLGLFLGLGIGLKDRIAGSQVDRDQSYIVLAATLSGQNPTAEVAVDLRQRLVSLGITNPSLTVLTLADDYAKSRDRDRQREADGLRMFGEALGGVTGPLVKVPTAVATGLPTVTPLALLPADASRASPSPAAPTSTPAAIAFAATPTDSAALTPPSAATITSTPEPSPAAIPKKATATPVRKTATPVKIPGTTINKSGIASTGTSKNVLVRKAPNTGAAIIVAIPNGSKVQVLKAVSGEAIIKGSPTWYLVNWRNGSGTVIQGYIYGLLVKITN